LPARDSEDEREWVPPEISEAPRSVYSRTRTSGEEPFDRSRSRLADALSEHPGPEAESPLERRLREAKERASTLEERIRQTEERVAEALRAIDQDSK
jgi:hypothetical protein